MEEDVLNALKSRAAYLPGGFDRDGRTIVVINVNNDLQLWNKKCLELCVNYIKRSLSNELLNAGLVVIVDAQKCPNRLSKAQTRSIVALFSDIPVNIYLVRPEGFWEKHVETCAKSHIKGEPTIVSKLRLLKNFKVDELPVELGGTLVYNHELWLDNRINFEDYRKKYEKILNDLENLHVVFLDHKSMRPTEADQELKACAQLHSSVQNRVEFIIEMGNRLVTRIADGYRLLHPSCNNNNNNNNNNSNNNNSSNDSETVSSHWTNTSHYRMPQDLIVTKTRIEMMLNKIEKKQTDIRCAWNDLERSVQESRELSALEEGVAFVTNWILGTAELMLNRKQLIGCDISTSEELRRCHDNLEMECRETYGFYAELLYKIDSYPSNKESFAYKDLISQKDFMDFVCRSFATRLERRRNMLITALRFFRLVTEYFDKTGAVFESLVMGNKVKDFDSAASNLHKLKDSQSTLENVERELIKEGEKLSDMLSMPVKDAMGRDLGIDYSSDIANIRDILDATIARRNIFIDSVELQKLTLEQVAHIHTYEMDALMAIKWMDDLYNVMIKCHSHVGCNVHEIQVQKDDLQTFQETGKSIYNYGWQLIEASQALRSSSKLDTEVCRTMCNQLKTTWTSLQAISQEHMTRLRVSSVFHRSVEEYCNKLRVLRGAVSALGDIEEPERRRNRLRKYLALRERLLVEVGRMVRLGRLLKTRLKEPFILDDTNSETMISENGGGNVVRPTGGNAIACDVISNKLTEIAGVAESLDSTLRDIQHDFDLFETNSSSSEKKFDHNRNGSLDEWSSSVRSTEDESFATASDGNFTPQSRSSSYHTASYLSSDKNSFDNSDIDECPEIDLDAPLFPIQFNRASANASFDSSDHSFLSAQQSLTNSPQSVQSSLTEISSYRDIEKSIQTKYNAANSDGTISNDFDPDDDDDDDDDNDDDDDDNEDDDENNSRNITPTPSMPIEILMNINATTTQAHHDDINRILNNHNNNDLNKDDADNDNDDDTDFESNSTGTGTRTGTGTGNGTATETGTDHLQKSSESNESEVRVCDDSNKSSNQNWGNRYYRNSVAKQTIKGFL